MSRRLRRNVYFTPRKKAEIRRRYYGTSIRRPLFARVLGDAAAQSLSAPYINPIRAYAKRNRANRTEAERELVRILNRLNGGVLRNRFQIEHIISGKWIVDFFFPENRLAIEVDGSIHFTPGQMQRDRRKEEDCKRSDITLVRIGNHEVFGDRELLVEKLREGWRAANRRKNVIIGKPAPT